MLRRSAVLVLVAGGVAGCGRGAPPPAPVSAQATIDRFFAAVKANDLSTMADLWGDDKGPLKGRISAEDLDKHLTVMRRNLVALGYRVIEGPLPVAGHDNIERFSVEFQYPTCTHVQPIDLVRARSGAWLVYDTHLEAGANPVAPCPASPGGTP